MTNRHFGQTAPIAVAGIALFCSACATMDSDGDRVGAPEAGNPYGVYVPPNVPQQAYAQTYPAPASPTAPPSSYMPPAPATQAIPSPAPSTVAAPSAKPSDPGLYAGDQGFSPWPGANGPSSAEQSSGNVANARDVVAGMGAAFRRCYNQALQVDPSVIGQARLTARIGPDGRVVSVAPSGVVGLPENMVACLMARVNSAQFAPPAGGGATIVIPVAFISK